ncbi:MAG: hypothetical protein NFW16_21045 [Candidatus Accumulibacter sp.]|uniref:hypothetical protein n=1 Tax=Accumulibacter sp. TaxID=2053492 RepID=UPI00258B0854|nr:hypothetical protein [Accumulibacter sp.]MCM8624153.1 hypothetical protein [Accumulibacter sp.]
MVAVCDFFIRVPDAERALSRPAKSINYHNLRRNVLADGTVEVSAIALASDLATRRRSAATIFRTLEIWRLAQ